MKICLIAHTFDVRKGGGTARYAKEILKGLVGRNFDVVPVSSSYQGPGNALAFHTLEVPIKIPYNCDIYHALTPLEAIYLPLFKNSIVTFHDIFPILYFDQIRPTSTRHGLRGRLGAFFDREYFRIACRRAIKCDSIIVNSPQTKNGIISHLNAQSSKIYVVSPGVHEEFCSFKESESKNFRIGTLSPLTPRKRVDVLIKSFLKTSNSDDELLIAGEGMEKERLRRLANGDDNIKFLDWVPESDLHEFYSSIDVFVMPSMAEGFGIPILEAMAHGKLVVTLSDARIPRELKDRTIDTDRTDLPKVLIKLKSKQMMEMRRENFKFAKNHTWDKTINNIIAIYKEMTNQCSF